MKRVLQAALVFGLVGLGWTVGRAQAPQAAAQPDFELVLTVPVGDVDIECVRGCKVAHIPIKGAADYKAKTEDACSRDGCRIRLAGVVQR